MLGQFDVRGIEYFRVRWRGHHGAQDFGGSNKRTGSAPRAVGSELEKGTFVMKKVLYGTTALVAAGLVAGEASAASGLKLGITGFYRNAIGGSFGNGPTTQIATTRRRRLDGGSRQFRPPGRVDAPGNPRQLHGPDDPRQRHHRRRAGRSERRKRRQVRQHHPGQPRLCRFQRQVRPGPRRRGELGPGHRLRRRSGQRDLELRRQQPERILQRRRLRPGPQQDHRARPMSATRRRGYFSTFGVAPMGSIGTCFGIEGKGNKIMYFSPSFGGLTFGVSFTPTGGQRRAGGGLSYGTDVTAPGPGNAGNNMLSVGVDYTHDFGGWNLTAGGGGEWAFTQYTPAGGNTDNKPSWYQAGLQIGFGHFAIGASGAYYVNYAPCRLCRHHGLVGRRRLGGQRWRQLHHRRLVLRSPGRVRQLPAERVGDHWHLGAWRQRRQREDVGCFVQHGLCPRAGHLARRPGCLYQCELRQSVGLRRHPCRFRTAVGVNASQVHSWEIDLGTAINF